MKTRAALLLASLALSTPLVMASRPVFAEQCGNTTVAVNVGCDSPTDNPIYVYLRAIIRFMSGAIGLGVVLMIIISGIQYMTSAGNPGSVAKAKSRLANAILGLVLFILMFGILNFLIPGGVLK